RTTSSPGLSKPYHRDHCPHALRKRMPALVFQWNDVGFNDNPAVANCRNGVADQTKMAFIATLVTNGTVNWNNTVFTFQNGTAIGAWVRTIPPAYYQMIASDICHSVIRITKINRQIDIEDFGRILDR
ncbi:18226_t:CDS:2, partial [Acaulospora morrowiae]